MSTAQMITRLKRAEGLAAIFAASADTFEFIQQSAAAYAKPGTGLYHAFLSVVPLACEGRDLVSHAPSMPHSRVTTGVIDPLDPETTSPIRAADAIADLSAELAHRLAEAVRLGRHAGDRDALRHASLAVTELAGILKRP